jgi:hypothetical protein
VSLKSKRDFLSAVTSKHEPLTHLQDALIRESLSEVLNELPDEAFTGLATKARITVTTSACWEETQAEGGTTKAIQDLVYLGRIGKPVAIRDLFTGKVESYKSLEDLDSAGEYIFWACLDYVLKHDLESARRIQVVVVDEPGKARTVTKSSAYTKVILDLVNKICAEPLKKGIESSTSGMSKANHGWNLFKTFFTEEWKDTVFHLSNRSRDSFDTYDLLTDTYRSVFVTSTDYKNATDYLRHDVAYILGRGWMLKCGIPPLLISIVESICFQPRDVYFHGTNGLAIGILVNSEENLRRIRMVRGIMMGDPLTKVILHLTNVCTRRLSYRIYSLEFMRKIFPFDAARIKEKVDALLAKGQK